MNKNIPSWVAPWAVRNNNRVATIETLCFRQGFSYRNRFNYLTACVSIALYGR